MNWLKIIMRQLQNRCPTHGWLLEAHGHYLMKCPEEHCKYAENWINGNPACYGEIDQYYYKKRKYLKAKQKIDDKELYSYRKPHNRLKK